MLNIHRHSLQSLCLNKFNGLDCIIHQNHLSFKSLLCDVERTNLLIKNKTAGKINKMSLTFVMGASILVVVVDCFLVSILPKEHICILLEVELNQLTSKLLRI